MVPSWIGYPEKIKEGKLKAGDCPGLERAFPGRDGERRVLFAQARLECSLARVAGLFLLPPDKAVRAGAAGLVYSSSAIRKKDIDTKISLNGVLKKLEACFTVVFNYQCPLWTGDKANACQHVGKIP